MSLVKRLTLVILVPFIGLYVAYVGLEINRTDQSATRQFEQTIESFARLTAQSIQPILWNLDYNTLMNVTQSLVEDSRVVGVLITMNNESDDPDSVYMIAGSLQDRDEVLTEGVALSELAPAADRYSHQVTRRIHYRDRLLGTAHFYFVDTDTRARIAREIQGFMVLAAVFILAYLASVLWLLNRQFKKPFEKVHRLRADVFRYLPLHSKPFRRRERSGTGHVARPRNRTEGQRRRPRPEQ